MKLIETCDSCNHKIKLEYDETLCTPQYCPFCGSELEDIDSDYEPDVLPADDEEEWN